MAVKISSEFGKRSALPGLLLAACVIAAGAVVVAPLAVPPVANAQQKIRIVDGTVVNAQGKPVAGAIVFMKNVTTLTVKSYVTTADGNYRFGQVGMDADYQVWAESDGHKSNTKTISNFDNKKQWTIPLKIDR